ncbi:MAG: aminoglycoside phosphotransferase [Acidimicrobiales bacterium]|nr:aminoglycoside phosphotransferase [Acidimicrobiales bacterium]
MLALGVDPGDADDVEVLRDGLSLVVRRGATLLRVRPRSLEPVADREVGVARVLEAVGVPTTPLDGSQQPRLVAGSVVTAWRWVEPVGVAGPAEIGVLARMLRSRTVGGPAYDAPRFDPLAAAKGAVAHLPVGDEQADTVRRLAHDLGPAWAAVADSDPAGVGIVHGDLHRDNVVAAASGPVLTDLELAGAGPPSYDAAPAVVAVHRYGAEPASLDAFLAALDADPRAWPGFVTCVAVYELWVTAWAVGVRDRSPELATEAALRIATVADGSSDARWHLH